MHTPTAYIEDFKRLGGRYWHDIEPPADRLTHRCHYTKATYDTPPLWKYRKRTPTSRAWHARLHSHSTEFGRDGASYWRVVLAGQRREEVVRIAA